MGHAPHFSKLKWAVACVCLLLLAGKSWGQNASPDNSAAVRTFHQQQLALVQQMQALVAQGATAQQIEAWRQQNAAQFAALQQQAQALSAASPKPAFAPITQIIPPEGATQEMIDFMVAQAQLVNALMAGGEVDFIKQNVVAIKALQQRAQTLAAQSDAQPLPVPPSLVIPPGSSAQMQAFLTLRDQLMREEVAVHNQYVTATPAAHDAALVQWHQQNASRYQQLQQLAQNLSSTPSN